MSLTTVTSIRQQVADQIRNSVLVDELKPEQRLKEVDLANRFGVGRGPVRDALLQLTQEGVLVYRQNRGVHVNPPVTDVVRGTLIRLRRELECDALTTLFPRITDEDRVEWRSLMQQLKSACEKESLTEIVKYDMDFHRSLLRKTGSKDLEDIWLTMTVRIRMGYSRHASTMEIYDIHHEIVEALCRGELQLTLKLLRNNIV